MNNLRGRPAAVLLLSAALVLVAACGSSAKKSAPSTAAPTRIDSQLVFGGPPECQERDLCLGQWRL